MSESIFNKLNTTSLNVSSNQGKKYIPWNTLWAELKKQFPKANFEFHCNNEGVPYFNSPLGLFVKVSVTIEDLTHTVTRPVYNNAFKAMKIEPYEYMTKQGKKSVVGAVSSDINDAQMRCLAKAIAFHGLGLFVFEDKPFADAEQIDSTQISMLSQKIADTNLNMSELFVAFSINKMSELIAVNFENAINLIELADSRKVSISQIVQESQR